MAKILGLGAPDSEAVAPDRAQALALDRLMADSARRPRLVTEAVARVQACTGRSDAAAALEQLRAALDVHLSALRRLDKVEVDELDQGARIKRLMSQAWAASRDAERHYISWTERIVDGERCTRRDEEKLAGDADAARAAKARGVLIVTWNAEVAARYGLPRRTATRI